MRLKSAFDLEAPVKSSAPGIDGLRFLVMAVTMFVFVTSSVAQQSLQQRLENYVKGQKATVGVSVDYLPGRSKPLHAGVHEHDTFITMSVIKFPIAVSTLHAIEIEKLSFKDAVSFDSVEVARNTYSPLCNGHKAPFTTDLKTALSASVSQSDNIATDKILDAMGGPAATEKFIQKCGFRTIGIGSAYRDLTPDNLKVNWSTPAEMNRLLMAFYQGKITNTANREWLLDQMIQSPTTSKRLKGKLPEGTKVAHKTGTYYTDQHSGNHAAINDVGILFLPDGGVVVLSVFVNHAHVTPDATEDMIATIARMVYDEFSK